MTVNQNRLPLWKYALPPAAVPIVAAHLRELETKLSAARGWGRRGGARAGAPPRSPLPPPSLDPKTPAGWGTPAAGLAGLWPAGLGDSPL